MMGRWLARLKSENTGDIQATKPTKPQQGDALVGFVGFVAPIPAPSKSIEREHAPANDAPEEVNTTCKAKWEAYEERAAIMEHMGGIDRSEAERQAALQTWPNTQAMNPSEVKVFIARLARFTDKGVNQDDAERLADKLVFRDREGDDRHLCLECVHLQGVGRRRCDNWRRADVAEAALAPDMVLALQRCSGFCPCNLGPEDLSANHQRN
jgi:hypothetical protein